MDFADLIYDQSYNASFHGELESIQYNVALAITGVIRRTSKKKKLYQTLCFESLHRDVGIENFVIFIKY